MAKKQKKDDLAAARTPSNGGKGTPTTTWRQRAGSVRQAFAGAFSRLMKPDGKAPKNGAGGGPAAAAEKPVVLRDMELFRRRRGKALARLEDCMRERSLKAGERLFARGEVSDELYLIRSGSLRIVQPLKQREGQYLTTFGRGDFVGEMAFLDGEPRPADAYAEKDCDLYVLSRSDFDSFAASHRKAAVDIVIGLARTLSLRLRCTTARMRQLEDA